MWMGWHIKQILVKTNNIQLFDPSLLFKIKLRHIVSSPNPNNQQENGGSKNNNHEDAGL